MYWAYIQYIEDFYSYELANIGPTTSRCYKNPVDHNYNYGYHNINSDDGLRNMSEISYGELSVTAATTLVESLQRPENLKGSFPHVIIWFEPAECAEVDGGCVGDRELSRNPRSGIRKGWYIAQIALCTEEWKETFMRIGGIKTQRGKTKVYKTIEALGDEMRRVFSENAAIQFRGI